MILPQAVYGSALDRTMASLLRYMHIVTQTYLLNAYTSIPPWARPPSKADTHLCHEKNKHFPGNAEKVCMQMASPQ